METIGRGPPLLLLEDLSKNSLILRKLLSTFASLSFKYQTLHATPANVPPDFNHFSFEYLQGEFCFYFSCTLKISLWYEDELHNTRSDLRFAIGRWGSLGEYSLLYYLGNRNERFSRVFDNFQFKEIRKTSYHSVLLFLVSQYFVTHNQFRDSRSRVIIHDLPVLKELREESIDTSKTVISCK